MSLNTQQRDYLNNLSPRARACKAIRRHPFPVIVPGEPIPAGVIVRAVSGGIDVIYICPNCGRTKTEETGPRGVIGMGEGKPKYSGGEGGKETYLAPKGLGLTAADYRQHYASSIAAMIRKEAK